MYGKPRGPLASASLMTLPPDLCDDIEPRDDVGLMDAGEVVRTPLWDAREEALRRRNVGDMRAVFGLEPPLDVEVPV